MDTPSIRETIEKHGTTAIAREMEIEISTLHGWKMADAIPGKGSLHELRAKAFWSAVKRLERVAARKSKQAA